MIDLTRKGGCVDDWTLEPRSPICVLAKALLKNKNLRKQTIRPDYYLIDPINFPPSEMEFAQVLRVKTLPLKTEDTVQATASRVAI